MPWYPRADEIVLSLQGGLGNQLFQWAFSQALRAAGRSVLVDRVRCRGDRPYALGQLVPQDQRLPRVVGAALALEDRLGWINDTSSLRKVKQVRSGMDPSVLARLGGRSYLLGYFQSLQYFTDVADSVRTAVLEHLQSLLSASGRDLAEQFRSDPHSVSVHVRRGDYLTVPSATQKHGVLDRGYYDRALQHLSDLGFTNRVWFSDDPQWVKENLAGVGDTICSPDLTTHDGGEIALMAACSARVLANSSFSWWGGWLGSPSTSAQPVVAPTLWFAGGHSDASDLVPADWTRL